MTETAATFLAPEMPTINYLGIEHPKTDGEMNYLKRKNIDEAIRQKYEEEGCLLIRYAQDIHSNCGINEQTTTREGGIKLHLPCGQNWPIPDRLPDDPEEDMILKPIWTSPNLIIVTVYKAPV